MTTAARARKKRTANMYKAEAEREIRVIQNEMKAKIISRAIECAEQILLVQDSDHDTRRAARSDWDDFLDKLRESPHRGAAITAHWDTIERVA